MKVLFITEREKIMKKFTVCVLSFLMLLVLLAPTTALGTIKVGLNYPETGPYSVQGLDQLRAAQLAVEEINSAGGINGEQVVLVTRDSQSKADLSRANVADLIDNEGVKMVFGGVSSGVAIASGEVCLEKGIPFFGTLTYSTATTGKKGHTNMFRECFNAWAGAKAMATYMSQNYAGKKLFYITADYTWGWSTEEAFRKFSNTTDAAVHKGTKTPFPGATDADFKKALTVAKMVNPDVLVLVLFGKDMATAVRTATMMGLKGKMQIIVPNLTLGMAESGGAKIMEGVVGTLPWCWNVPEKYGFQRGKDFVNAFSSKYSRYPSTAGASAYTIMFEYKGAVERAGGFDTAGVITALEGHDYTLLKDKQTWRAFDHQSIQTVYVVKCKAEADVLKDQYKLDYFEIISKMDGNTAFRTRAEWNAAREAAGMPSSL
jgi:branched-chain amino acid transport system substrate-binding protein